MADNVTLPGGPTVRAKDLGGGLLLLLSGLAKIDGTDAIGPILDAVGLTASADRVFAITPNDGVALAVIPKALLCTVAGIVAVKGTDAAAVNIPVIAGQVLPIRARYVMATNTTATVVGLA